MNPYAMELTNTKTGDYGWFILRKHLPDDHWLGSTKKVENWSENDIIQFENGNLNSLHSWSKSKSYFEDNGWDLSALFEPVKWKQLTNSKTGETWYWILRGDLPENHWMKKQLGVINDDDTIHFSNLEFLTYEENPLKAGISFACSWGWNPKDNSMYGEQGWDLSPLFAQDQPQAKCKAEVFVVNTGVFKDDHDAAKAAGYKFFTNKTVLKTWPEEGRYYAVGDPHGFEPIKGYHDLSYYKGYHDLPDEEEKMTDKKCASFKTEVYLSTDSNWKQSRDLAKSLGYEFFTTPIYAHHGCYFLTSDQDGETKVYGYHELPNEKPLSVNEDEEQTVAQYKEDVFMAGPEPGGIGGQKKKAKELGFKFFTNPSYQNWSDHGVYFSTDDPDYNKIFGYEELPSKETEAETVYYLADLVIPVTNNGVTRYFIYRKDLPDPTMHPSHEAENTNEFDILWFASPSGMVDDEYDWDQAGWCAATEDASSFYIDQGWDLSPLMETINNHPKKETGEETANVESTPDPTQRTRKVLDAAVFYASIHGVNYVGTEHLLLALSQEKGGIAAQVFADLDISPEDIFFSLEKLVSPA